jgi:hypothetical protein
MGARGFILLLTKAFISIDIVAFLVACPSSSFHGSQFFSLILTFSFILTTNGIKMQARWVVLIFR